MNHFCFVHVSLLLILTLAILVLVCVALVAMKEIIYGVYISTRTGSEIDHWLTNTSAVPKVLVVASTIMHHHSQAHRLPQWGQRTREKRPGCMIR